VVSSGRRTSFRIANRPGGMQSPRQSRRSQHGDRTALVFFPRFLYNL
jgi:hypothetical protein